MSIRFNPSTSSVVIGYSDSSRAGYIAAHESTEGYFFDLARNAISLRSKKQTIVALSSWEVEYISLCTAAKESTWLSKVLCFLLGHVDLTPICVLADSHSSTSLAEIMPINAHSKHMDIRHHFVREAVSFRKAHSRTFLAMSKPLSR